MDTGSNNNDVDVAEIGFPDLTWAHLDGIDGWKDFPDMLEKVVPHQVGMMMFGEVIGSMDD